MAPARPQPQPATPERRRARTLQRVGTPDEVRRASERWRAAGLVVGLVPTMGALHEGHRSLVRRARRECDRVVVSIFVNPRQFGAHEDLDRYPRTLEADLAMLEEEGADAAWVPAVDAMYPPGAVTSVHVGGPLTATLEGAARPGHFDGVALVVTKLLAAARPDRAYFGDKDAQQLAVVTRLVRDLDLGVTVVRCALVRDADGLALSSRNRFLAPEERRQALALPRGLAAAAGSFEAGERDAAVLRAVVESALAGARDLRPEYVALVDPETFEPVGTAATGSRIAVAARIGVTRLIDTLCLGIDAAPVVPAESEAASAPGA